MRTWEQRTTDGRRGQGKILARRKPLSKKPHLYIYGAKGWRRVELWAPTKNGYVLINTVPARVPQAKIMQVAKVMCELYKERTFGP